MCTKVLVLVSLKKEFVDESMNRLYAMVLSNKLVSFALRWKVAVVGFIVMWRLSKRGQVLFQSVVAISLVIRPKRCVL